MSSKGYMEEVPTILYLVPFLASGVYGIYLWAANGVSALLPSTVYLAVTRDPYVFIVSSVAAMLGMVVEVGSAEAADRQAKVKSAAGTLQSIAVASFVLALIFALYSNGFVHVSDAATDFMVGRYAVVFPMMMVLLSYLITLQARINSLRNPKVLGCIVMLLVPVVVYEIGRRETALGLGSGLALIVVGVFLFVRNPTKTAKAKQR